MTGAGPMLLFMLLASKKGGSASRTTRKSVKLEPGRSYRTRMELQKVTPAYTIDQAFMDGVKRGLALGSARDITSSLGPPPWVEYTITPAVSVTVETGKPHTMQLGEYSVTIVYRWIRPVPDAYV